MATLRLSSSLTMACSSVFIPVSTAVVYLRIYTRRLQKESMGTDDWLMIPAFVLVIGMQVTMIIEVSRKMIGYPDPNFKPGVLDARTNLAFWPFELQQIPALGLVKLSVVFFYRRVFCISRASWRHWVTAVTISLISAWTVAFFFSFLFICGVTPSNYWKSAADERTYCVATQKLHLSFAVSDTILDVLVLAIVIPMIWNLRLSVARKVAITGIFGLGLVTIAASITRMAVFVQATTLRYDPNLDFEYLDTSAIYWSMLETGLGFIAANLLVLYGLLTHHKPKSRFQSLSSLMSTQPDSLRGNQSVGHDAHLPFDGKSLSPLYTTETRGGDGTSVTERDVEKVYLDDENIYVRKDFATTVVRREEQ